MQSTSPTELQATGEETKVRVSRARKLVLTAGLLSGLISFGIGEAIYNLIPPQRVPQKIRMSNIEVLLPSHHTENAAAAKNAALAFGLLGTCLGGLLGMAGGLARQSKSATVTAGLLGAALAAALGAGVSLALLPYGLQAQLDHTDNDLAIALAMHCLSWGPLGAAAGLAFAVGLGQKGMAIQTVTAGLTGALAGTICFELIGTVFFSHAGTIYPIAITWPTRLMARLLVTIGTAAILVLIIATPRARYLPCRLILLCHRSRLESAWCRPSLNSSFRTLIAGEEASTRAAAFLERSHHGRIEGLKRTSNAGIFVDFGWARAADDHRRNGGKAQYISHCIGRRHRQCLSRTLDERTGRIDLHADNPHALLRRLDQHRACERQSMNIGHVQCD